MIKNTKNKLTEKIPESPNKYCVPLELKTWEDKANYLKQIHAEIERAKKEPICW